MVAAVGVFRVLAWEVGWRWFLRLCLVFYVCLWLVRGVLQLPVFEFCWIAGYLFVLVLVRLGGLGFRVCCYCVAFGFVGFD